MKRLFPLALLILVVLAISAAGCSKNDLGVAPKFGAALGGSPRDTTPKPPHPTPPPDTSIVAVQFLGADSTQAGTTGTSRWRLGNNGKKPATFNWSLTVADSSWPGYPIQGMQRIGPGRTADISVPVPVPGFAPSGFYTLQLAAGTSPTNTSVGYGAIRVFGNDQPPPPPPTPAVIFWSADSVHAGQTSQTAWQVHNESNHDFTMAWSLSSVSGWAGLPKTGTVDLAPNATQLLFVSVDVPDTAAAGPRRVDMQVSRPDGLPPASTPGFISVLP